MSETQPILEMQDVNVTALTDPTLAVLENVNWSVRPGEFWVVAGPPHSGKSDLLLHAAGLLMPVAGSCRVFGRETEELGENHLADRLRVALTFADAKLFNQFSIAENIALPLRYHRRLAEKEIAQTVEELLVLLELTECASLNPANVAGVWRHRAALARALVLKPELLLLDNPHGSLPQRHRHWLVDLLDQLWAGHPLLGGRSLTIVATTDDLHAWQHPQRKFAAVHEGSFSVLGPWGGEAFNHDAAVRELLAVNPERKDG